MSPTFGNGKICYLVIPAVDIKTSAEFYRKVFDWQIRSREDGSVSFDDGVGEVSGTWVQGLPPSAEPGISIHIMVDDMEKTLALLEASGGQVVQPVSADSPEITAKFRDPGGNVLGLYQHGGRKSK